MTDLTREEYEEVKAKVKQIEQFIREDILPYIEGCYEIPFGYEKTRSGKSHLRFYVYDYGTGMHGYSGSLWMSFDENYKPSECGGGVSIYNSWNYGGNFGYQLISDWQRIKNKLLDLKVKKARELSERKSVLQSFVV